MNHYASHLLDPDSHLYWASRPGHVRHQAFVFELEQSQVLTRVEWKDRGDPMGVARLSLEALTEKTWQKLCDWDAAKTPEWQSQVLHLSMRSDQWKLTFLTNHGDENHLVVQAVRFIVKCQPVQSSHNVDHVQRINQRLWSDQLFTDVKVICGRRSFPAHRAVLAAASPVFAAMLNSEMQESRAREIHITDASERAVEDTLEYIYTGQVGEAAGCGSVVLAHKYDIAGFVEYAAPVALGNLTAQNVVEEIRTLRAHADDKELGPVFEALQNKVHDTPSLFRAVLLGV